MRILFLTNFYKVQETGGEDQSCQQVVQGLTERGHATLVLTSMHGTNNVPVEAHGIYRSLYLEMDLVPLRHSLTFFTQRKAREQHNLRCLERVLEQFAPDIIFIWGMWNLPRSLAALAEARYPDHVVYRFATYWPTLPSQHEYYWRAPGRKWYSKLTKKMLGQVALAMLARENRRPRLNFKHAICVSARTRTRLVEAGIPLANARVIHTGIDAKKYLTDQQKQSGDGERILNLLCAGRLVVEKGIETTIQALEKLVLHQNKRNIRLTVAGSGSEDYENHLRHLVTQAGLDNYVSFLGHVPPEEMPRLLQQFDVLLMPSTWDEPFSRMVLEGMASGLVIVATPRGGTIEILTDGENGLLFAPGDGQDLASKISRLVEDPVLRRKLANAGQQTVMERFTMTRMMDQIEGYLQEVVRSSSDKIDSHPESVEEGFMMAAPPMVSVIIPTHNRKGPLLETLRSLAQQTYPRDRFEVIVVDDGSTDDTPSIADQEFPFTFTYVRQKNQGATAARNNGAMLSQAEILVFIDDDITVSSQSLAALAEISCQQIRVVVIGTLIGRSRGRESIYTAIMKDSPGHAQEAADNVVVHFVDCNTELIACKRSDFLELGMFHDPTSGHGWPNWDDVDFGYRAHRSGFRLLRSNKAIGDHWDYSLADRMTACQRWYRAAKSAVWLFNKHPELRNHIPMLYDKTPLAWGQDSPGLIARKLVRSLMSSPLMLGSMEKVIGLLEEHRPSPAVLRRLYYWVQGAYMFQGYRGGLREFEQAGIHSS